MKRIKLDKGDKAILKDGRIADIWSKYSKRYPELSYEDLKERLYLNLRGA